VSRATKGNDFETARLRISAPQHQSYLGRETIHQALQVIVQLSRSQAIKQLVPWFLGLLEVANVLPNLAVDLDLDTGLLRDVFKVPCFSQASHLQAASH
jgi:hypothetical protein